MKLILKLVEKNYGGSLCVLSGQKDVENGNNMNCVSPFIVHSLKGDFPTRCNHCLNCKIQYANQWATRLLHESLNYEFSSFLTLTYSDEYNPFELSIDVAQKWQKRLRTSYFRAGHKDKLKFFTCGEYGNESSYFSLDGIGRPHYHSIVFGLNPYSDETYQLLKDTWVYQDYELLDRHKLIESVNYYNARYCAQYVLKKYNDDDFIKSVYGDKQQPFRIMSKGIGKNYIEKNKDFLEEFNLMYAGNGKALISLPSYYKKHIGTTANYDTVINAIKNQNSIIENINIEKKNHDRMIFFKRGTL